MNTTKKMQTVAECIDQAIERSSKSDLEVAREIGYSDPTEIMLLRTGGMQLPCALIKPIAETLRIDVLYLLRLALNEYLPGSFAAVETCLGTKITTEHELEIIEAFRSCSDDNDPSVIILEEPGKITIAVR